MAIVGLGQLQQGGYAEKPLMTSGEDLRDLHRFLKPENLSYSAQDVINSILQKPSSMI